MTSPNARFDGFEKQFKADCESFYEDFSISSYLKLREKYPEQHIPIYRFGGFDSIFPLHDELSKFGIDGKLIAGVMDADPDCIDLLCLKLLGLLEKERAAKADGATQLQSRRLAPSRSSYCILVCLCFEAMDRYDDSQAASSLGFLVQQLLLPGLTDFQKEMRKRQLRQNAIDAGAHLLAIGRRPTMRKVATMLDVAPSTISRLFAGEAAFLVESERFKSAVEAVSGRAFLEPRSYPKE